MDDEAICVNFDVEIEKERLLEREYIKELLEEEESKLYDNNSNENEDNFFKEEQYRQLLNECGYTASLYSELEMSESSTPFIKYKSLVHKMTDISDGQKLVYKRLISKGEGSKVPPSALVIYNYKFYHEEQLEPFDSTRLKRRPDRQRVGVGQLLPGLDLALQSMCKKERSLFVCDCSVMFGDMGSPPRIPGGVDIYAEVEVIDFTEKNLIDDFFDMSIDDRLDLSFEDMINLVNQCRDDANAAVRNKRFGVALNKYLRGLDILYAMPLSDDTHEETRWRHVVKFHLNMAHCNIKLNRGPAAIKCCNTVLSKQPNNAKALYRKAKGLMMIGEYDEAAKFLRLANRYSPNCTEILTAMTENEDLKLLYVDSEKLMAQSMLNMKLDSVKHEAKEILPDLTTEFAIDLRAQLEDFKRMDGIKSFPKLKGLSDDEVNVLKALCKEYRLECIVNDGVVIRKK